MANSDRLSIFEAHPDAIEEARLDALAEADIEAGRVVGHVDVVRWLQSWGTTQKLPRPRPKP